MAYKDPKRQKESHDRHYLRNKEKIIERSRISNIAKRARNKEYIAEYLGSHSCVDCGESDPIVLEFDHVRGEKRKDVSVMVQQCCSIQTIRNEIDKCEVRCANCHRRVTHKRRLSYSRTVSTSD